MKRSTGDIIQVKVANAVEHCMVLSIDDGFMHIRRMSDDFLFVIYEHNYSLIVDSPVQRVFERTNPSNGLSELWVRGYEIRQNSNIDSLKELLGHICADLAIKPADEGLLKEQQIVSEQLASSERLARIN